MSYITQIEVGGTTYDIGVNVAIDGLSNVTITSVSENQILKYDGEKWVNASITSGSTTLSGLTDVTITSVASGQVLKYDGEKWVNGADSGAVTSATQPLEISNGALSLNYTSTGVGALAYDSTSHKLYVPYTCYEAGSGISIGNDYKIGVSFSGSGTATSAARSDHSHSLGDVSGVTVSNPANNQVLTYSNGVWINDSPNLGGTKIVTESGKISLQPNITGGVQGNTRGGGAVDLQFQRSTAAQVASGNNSTAFGMANTVSGAGSFAAGFQNTVSGGMSAALGQSNTASGTNSFSAGLSNTASGSQGIAIGHNNTSSMQGSLAIGQNNTSSKISSVALGQSNVVDGVYSTVVGSSNTLQSTSGATINYSYCFGRNNTVNSSSSVVVGISNTVSKPGNLAFGTSNTVSADSAVAIGTSNESSGLSGVSLGYSNTASGNYSFAAGKLNISSGLSSFSVGSDNTSSGINSSVFGKSNTTSGNYSSTFGYNVNNNVPGVVCNNNSTSNSSSYLNTYGHCGFKGIKLKGKDNSFWDLSLSDVLIAKIHVISVGRSDHQVQDIIVSGCTLVRNSVEYKCDVSASFTFYINDGHLYIQAPNSDYEIQVGIFYTLASGAGSVSSSSSSSSPE